MSLEQVAAVRSESIIIGSPPIGLWCNGESSQRLPILRLIHRGPEIVRGGERRGRMLLQCKPCWFRGDEARSRGAGLCWKAYAQAGFTLVELLVVVAVIGILASLLLPALGRAKEKGKSVRCVSNVRQLAIGATLYAEEH